MRIKNKTHWPSKPIRQIALRLAKAEPLLRPEGRRHLVIELVYKKGDWVYGGYARYGTGKFPGRVTIKLPRRKHNVAVLDTVQVAQIIAHEIGHAVGLRHRDMTGLTRYTWKDGWREYYKWAAEYKVSGAPEPEPIIKEVTVEQRELRLRIRREANLAKAQRMVKKHAAAVKRSQTLLRKWQGRLRAAERRIQVVTITPARGLDKRSGRKFRLEESA